MAAKDPAFIVSLGRGHYHLQNKMMKWCEHNLGQGGWVYYYDGMDDNNWAISCTFGHTKIYFKEEKDAVFFSLRWE
jgi:hypothetical protein